jgi:hypothetical protein
MSEQSYRAVADELEAEVRAVRGQRMRAMELKERAEEALSRAESDIAADPQIISRLDHFLMILTEAAKENVCTNTKCPHYSKKCKMR